MGLEQDLFCFVSCACHLGCCPSDSAEKTDVKSICRSSPSGTILLGANPMEKASVDSWLNVAMQPDVATHFASIDAYLATHSFLGGPRLQLSDIALYFACAPLANTVTKEQVNLRRWLKQCEHSLRTLAPGCKVVPSANLEVVYAPVSFPLPSASTSPAVKGTAAESDGSGSAAPQPAKNSQKEGALPPSKKAEKKDKKESKATPSPAQPAAVASTGEDEFACPTKLDIRVGVIIKAWEHETAEKLFCEEIDVGEAAPRLIASGLRPFYKLDEMQGRRCLVLANLKARSLVGFKSEGMVLCASNADHTVVKFVEPPASAPPGSRITFADRTGEPATPAQIQKKDVLAKVMPLLKTNEQGVVCYDGKPCSAGEFGPCTSEVTLGSVA